MTGHREQRGADAVARDVEQKDDQPVGRGPVIVETVAAQLGRRLKNPIGAERPFGRRLGQKVLDVVGGLGELSLELPLARRAGP